MSDVLVRGAQFVEAYAALTGDPAAFAWLDQVANEVGNIPIDNDGERAYIGEALQRTNDALLAVIPLLVVNASKSAHQAWLDGRTPVVTEDTVRGELLRIIGGSS